MKRRPHWDDDLVEAVTDHMYHCVDCLDEDYNEEDWRERWTYGVIAAEEPLSIQTNIATLSHELNLAEAALGKIRAIHRPDPTGSWCVHCQWEWPCRTYRCAGGAA